MAEPTRVPLPQESDLRNNFENEELLIDKQE